MSITRRWSQDDDIALGAKVEFLLRSDSYEERPRRVEAKETHMSLVFLTDDHAYKLKKPVRLPYLDYSTVALRRRNCEEEVRLNRRLAPDVYLDAIPIVLDSGGNLHIGGDGRVVDWLVKMRRLPADGTLEHAIRAGRADQADVRRVAAALATFYLSAPRVPISPETYRRQLERDVEESSVELLRPGFGLPAALIGKIVTRLRHVLATRKELFDRRVVDGRIVEGHGDLRPEHVYLGTHPLVTDCLEFNRDFRRVDPVDEIAYLAMECERGGAAEVGSWLFDSYAGSADDSPPLALVAFYKSFRALVRAKIAIWHLNDSDVRDPQKWRGRAEEYLAMADAHSRLAS
jgi:aminoglycoside phosphotransferase family enzyme